MCGQPGWGTRPDPEMTIGSPLNSRSCLGSHLWTRVRLIVARKAGVSFLQIDKARVRHTFREHDTSSPAAQRPDFFLIPVQAQVIASRVWGRVFWKGQGSSRREEACSTRSFQSHWLSRSQDSLCNLAPLTLLAHTPKDAPLGGRDPSRWTCQCSSLELYTRVSGPEGQFPRKHVCTNKQRLKQNNQVLVGWSNSTVQRHLLAQGQPTFDHRHLIVSHKPARSDPCAQSQE